MTRVFFETDQHYADGCFTSTRRRGFCSSCGLQCTVRQDWTANNHQRVKPGAGRPRFENCPGSGALASKEPK